MTSSSSSSSSTAPLADRFRLVQLTREELKVLTKTNDYAQWGAPALSASQYQRKEALQRATAHSQRGSIFWALVEKKPGDADDSMSDAALDASRDAICAHCESHRFSCVVRSASGAVTHGYSHHIGSVFTLPELRKQGLASFFLREVAARMAQLPDALASVLYSDIGPRFYARLGWHAHPSTNAELDATATRNIAAIVDENEIEGKKLFLDDELDALLARDNRRRVDEIASDAYAGREVFAPLPTRDSIEWQFCVGEYYAELRGFSPLPAQCGLWLADDAFVVWCHSHRSEALNVVHVRVPSGDHEHAVVLTLLRAALAEAQAFNLKRVVLWDPPAQLFAPDIVAALDINKREREDSLSSLMVFAQHREGDGSAEALPIWVGNEKFAWV